MIAFFEADYTLLGDEIMSSQQNSQKNFEQIRCAPESENTSGSSVKMGS